MPDSECTDAGFAGRTGVTVEAEAEGGGVMSFLSGGTILPPDVPADMLGARLEGRLGGLLEGRVPGVLWLPQSLSETVGDEAEEALETVFFSFELDESDSASFCRDPRVWPGCLSYVPASGGGSGTAGLVVDCFRLARWAFGGGVTVLGDILSAAFN